MAIARPSIQEGSIAGIKTVWADAGPPARGALLFRVGSSDEPLASAGITHLVEHLTLSTLGQQMYQYNGLVSPLLTVFHCQGRPEDVQQFVSAVTSALTSLPVERLEDEKRILRAEAANQRRGSWASHLVMRYGASGPGVLDYPEYGLRRLTANDVNEWVRRWFTAENCAIWTSFPPPRELQPSLPTGTHMFAPDPVPLSMTFPNRVEHQVAVVGVTMTGSRSLELTVGCRILKARLVDRLRRSMAVAYTPNVSYAQVGGTTAHLVVGSDGAKEDASPIADALLEELARYRDAGPNADELAADHEAFRVAQLDPQSVMGELHFHCLDYLLSPDAGFEEYRADRDAARARVTAESVAAAFASAWESAMVFVPAGTTGAATAIRLVPAWSPSPVAGATLARRAVLPGGAPAGSRLMSSSEGLNMVVAPKNGDVAIRYRDVAALLTWLNGDRVLIGNDGFRLVLRAGEWEGQADLVEQIDAAVPTDRVVSMDEPGIDAAATAGLCEVCRKGPSAEIRVRRVVGQRGTTVRGIRVRACRDCGRYLVREWTADTLRPRLGWVTHAFVAPVVASTNLPASLRLRRLARPERTAPDGHWVPRQPAFTRWRTLGGMLEVVAAFAFLAMIIVGVASGAFRISSDGGGNGNGVPSFSLPPGFSLPAFTLGPNGSLPTDLFNSPTPAP